MIGFGSMIAMYLFLLCVSERYRTDNAEMFRFQTTTFHVAARNPLATLALVLAFVLPIIVTENM